MILKTVENCYYAFQFSENSRAFFDFQVLNNNYKIYDNYELSSVNNESHLVPKILKEYPAEALKFSNFYVNFLGQLTEFTEPKEIKFNTSFSENAGFFKLGGVNFQPTDFFIVKGAPVEVQNFEFFIDFETSVVAFKINQLKNK